MINQSTKAYFPALTGIRAVAAYLVFIHHFNPFEGFANNYSIEIGKAIVDQLHIGVSIFFVLSGFLIAFRYVDRIEPTITWAKKYMINRFARIYPLFFILTLITFIVMPIRDVHPDYEWNATTTSIDKVISVFANFTLTRAFFKNLLFIGVPTAWSLTVEECFYLSAPFILIFVRKRPTRLVLVALLLLSSGFLLTFMSTLTDLYGSFMRPVTFVLGYTYFGRCVEFMMGIGLALWIRKRGNGPAKSGTTLIGVLFIVVCLVFMVMTNWGYQIADNLPLSFSTLMINNLILPLGVFVLFHGLLHEETWFRRLLSTPLFNILGKSSYAFYLIHLGLFSDLVTQLIGGNVLVLFLLSNIASILLYKLVEHPFHTAILRRFKSQHVLNPQQ
ncbi:acyltransferase [Hymenobacter sp. ISL-91]|uniref:acyltransferase family protein n=1 Tax=Hymenobacter sp. ISL-91 TaxID=2819151 RepID=UPI001BE79558|nr:acyltransferase [Hymenobacter sp. ISL-91]MBT2558536.1 acyltransferase [Hymenobacter sp. ISL-91]